MARKKYVDATEYQFPGGDLVEFLKKIGLKIREYQFPRGDLVEKKKSGALGL